MGEYIMLTTTERYRTVTENPNLEIVGEYEYLFFGKKKVWFTICRIVSGENARIVIQGVSEVFPDNSIPLKVFPKFQSIRDIEKDIYELDINEESRIVKVS